MKCSWCLEKKVKELAKVYNYKIPQWEMQNAIEQTPDAVATLSHGSTVCIACFVRINSGWNEGHIV